MSAVNGCNVSVGLTGVQSKSGKHGTGFNEQCKLLFEPHIPKTFTRCKKVGNLISSGEFLLRIHKIIYVKYHHQSYALGTSNVRPSAVFCDVKLALLLLLFTVLKADVSVVGVKLCNI